MTEARVPCIGKGCGRTAPAAKYEPGTEVICRYCWKRVPPHLKRRFKALKRRGRVLDRLARNGTKESARFERAYEALDRQVCRNWDEIKASFSEASKPVGLDAFLEEQGLA